MKRVYTSIAILFFCLASSNTVNAQDSITEETQSSSEVEVTLDTIEPENISTIYNEELPFSDEYKLQQLRLLEIAYLNDQLTTEDYNNLKNEMENAQTTEEIATVWDRAYQKNESLTSFLFSFSEKYYSIKNNIQRHTESGLLTDEQVVDLLNKLNAANSLDELNLVNDALNEIISKNNVDDNSTSSSTTVDSSETTTKETSTLQESTTEETTSPITSNNDKTLPKTGETNQKKLLFLGILIVAIGILIIGFKFLSAKKNK